MKLTKKQKYVLKVGQSVEMEHHMGKSKALQIAKDHIEEMGWNYYDALLKMEKMLQKKNKVKK
jgi:hypothetical protein